ncbi:hypothetical protein HDU77_001643 [Chytriomyces hyalinus]|nr:hypothetical protein HDU77_001643 [Chytriomyces hyalinus]
MRPQTAPAPRTALRPVTAKLRCPPPSTSCEDKEPSNATQVQPTVSRRMTFCSDDMHYEPLTIQSRRSSMQIPSGTRNFSILTGQPGFPVETDPPSRSRTQRPFTSLPRTQTCSRDPTLSTGIATEVVDSRGCPRVPSYVNPASIRQPRAIASAPAFTRTGYRLSIDASEMPSALYQTPYKVKRVRSSKSVREEDLVTVNNCKSRLYPRHQRRKDEIEALEGLLLEKHTFQRSGLSKNQIDVVKNTINSGEKRRLAHRNKATSDKCWPPRSASVNVVQARGTSLLNSDEFMQATSFNNARPKSVRNSDASPIYPAPSFIAIPSRKNSFQPFNEVPALDEIEEYAEEFQNGIYYQDVPEVVAEDWIETDPFTLQRVPAIHEPEDSYSTGLESFENEFHVEKPHLLGESVLAQLEQDDSKNTNAVDGADAFVKKSAELPRIHPSVAIKIEGEYHDGNSKISRHEIDLSSDSESTSSSQSFPSVKLYRNPKLLQEQEASVPDPPLRVAVDYKLMYSEMVDPRIIGDSLLNLVRPDLTNEDAIAETEMKIVLHDLQHWSQSKFSDLFKDGLTEAKSFITEFENMQKPQNLGNNRLTQVSNSSAPRASNFSNASAGMQLSSANGRRSSVGRPSVYTYQSTGERAHNTEFDELLAMQPWKPNLAETDGRKKGKGMSIEKGISEQLTRKLKMDFLAACAKTGDQEATMHQRAVSLAHEASIGNLSTDEDSFKRNGKSMKEKSSIDAVKRARYGTAWYMNPSEWEAISQDPNVTDLQRLEKKNIHKLLHSIITRQKAAIHAQQQKLAVLEINANRVAVALNQ